MFSSFFEICKGWTRRCSGHSLEMEKMRSFSSLSLAVLDGLFLFLLSLRKGREGALR